MSPARLSPATRRLARHGSSRLRVASELADRTKRAQRGGPADDEREALVRAASRPLAQQATDVDTTLTTKGQYRERYVAMAGES